MSELVGRTYYRGESGYEAARSAAVKNGRTPDRFPDVIVQAASDADVIAAVRLAKRNGLKIGIRSGGHSWAGVFLRDGGMLIDLAAMNSFTVDREACFGLALGPAPHGQELRSVKDVAGESQRVA